MADEERKSNRGARGQLVAMQEFMEQLRGGTYRVNGYITVHQDGSLEFFDCVFVPATVALVRASEHVH